MNRILGLAVLMAAIAGCSTAPKGHEAKANLHEDVQETLTQMQGMDSELARFLSPEKAYGYVVFPSVGEGGLIVGGAYGHGEVYEQGKFIGFADISKASIGAQIGGQAFAEVIVFEDAKTLERFKKGGVKFDATASAVIMKSGAAATAHYTEGVAVFIKPKGGAMAQAAIGGQSFSFTPAMGPTPAAP